MMDGGDPGTILAKAAARAGRRAQELALVLIAWALLVSLSVVSERVDLALLWSLFFLWPALVLWDGYRGAKRLPLVVDGDRLKLYPLTAQELRRAELPPSVQLREIVVISVRDVMKGKIEDFPGRVHWYVLRLQLPKGRDLEVSSVREPVALHAILAALDGAGSLEQNPEAKGVLACWDPVSSKFRSPLGRD